MKNIWQDLAKPIIALAPMEDVTDHIFRRVVAKAAAPDLYFSEFTNATGWVHAGDKATGGRLIKDKAEKYPIVAQIWGGVPEDIEKLAKHCKKIGYKAIDINMGCPAKQAVKNGGGSAMIKQPDLAAQIIASAKKAGLPVSVKTRLGYSSLEEMEGWVSHLLKQDLAALTLHLRTRKEMSKVPAHWELMPEIKRLRDKLAPDTLLLGNGDIYDRQHAEEIITKTGIDGVMIGRGIFTNVFAFEKNKTEHSKEELLNMLKYHLELFEKENVINRPFETMKRFFKIYIRDFNGAHELRTSLMTTTSVKESLGLVSDSLSINKQTSTVSGLGHLRYHVQMHSRIKAIIFDSDGTLVDTKKLILHGFKTVLKQHGLDHLTTDTYIKQRLGKPVPETYQQLLAGHHLKLDIDELVKEHDKVQNENTHLIKAYDQTEHLLKLWRTEGIKICLFTSGNMMMIERNLSAAGINNPLDLFDAIVTADDDLPRKPEPDAIQELLKRVSVEAENSVVVGDHPYDIVSGIRAKAGLKIGVLHGFGETKELLEAGADALSDDLIGLNHILNFAID